MKSLSKILLVMLTLSFFLFVHGISTGWSKENSASNVQGAQLWSQNCARCHNIRPPSSYSDRNWDIIVHHMRVRANLTAEEYESIRNFLKSAN